MAEGTLGASSGAPRKGAPCQRLEGVDAAVVPGGVGGLKLARGGAPTDTDGLEVRLQTPGVVTGESRTLQSASPGCQNLG